MPKQGLPVTPALVTWARTRAGLSIEDAKKFGKIDEWESGTSGPSYPQLEALATALKVPVAAFFFPEPPNLPNIEQTFRTLPDAELAEIPGRVKLLLRKAKAFQLNLVELTGGKNPARRMIINDLKFAADADVAKAAAQVREYLGVSIETQQSWDDDETALKAWRQALQEVGIFVFKDAFKVEEFSGFCLYDDSFPLIYVNNSAAKTRQIFTLFHELAHLLFKTSGIDTLDGGYIEKLHGDPKKIEVFCNSFAAEFLFPTTAFEKEMLGQDPTEVIAERLAARYHISREFVFRRFLDRSWIDEAVYIAAAKRWSQQRRSGSGGDYYWTKLSYLGREYVALALSEFHRSRISEVQLANYLDTKPKNLAGIEDYFARGSS
ncbi:ImmA/IrrE family metallo-endopeptidase [Bradyrhizobium yuanmingense]|uniref:helix-turn-helix domain-containing protein n=1 Tax=Bradyrhizobium yuanmingense TaxID=108015 RepID=UPI0012F99DDA|nr:ImmA/IrrE family metallo-endopeptidase [Bradyrhizobium yuanmingense]MVT55736.1 ImmA/IrrE family metallo-endopeptidase [Bradyrhizobium yuanmingense]